MIFVQKIIDFLFPRQCLNCQTKGAYLCKECKKLLKPHPTICPSCHQYNKNFKICLECQIHHDRDLNGIIIGFEYQNLIKKMILKLKYYHKKELANFLAKRLKYVLLSHKLINSKNSIITHIPSHWYRKYFVKGYNQSKLLAQNLANQTNITHYNILKKSKKTKSQTNLSREKRITNIQGAFKLDKKDLNLQGKTIIIVDDITTTGSTLNEAAKAIKTKYNNINIRGLVVGRHN